VKKDFQLFFFQTQILTKKLLVKMVGIFIKMEDEKAHQFGLKKPNLLN